MLAPARSLVFCGLLEFVVAFASAPVFAEASLWPGETLPTPVRKDLLDAGAFAEWTEGREVPLSTRTPSKDPSAVIWTVGNTYPSHDGVYFGSAKTAETSHLRLAFLEPVPVGSVLTLGDVAVSVLKAGVPHPGDLTDESLWIPAERLEAGLTTSEQPHDIQFALWVLPEGTATTALRFTHRSQPTDKTYTGKLNGCVVFEDRFANVAPFASASARQNTRHAEKILNQKHDRWQTWENVDLEAALKNGLSAVSPENPEWVMLQWSEPVTLEGVLTLWTGFGAMDVQKFTGPDTRNPRDATDADWETVGTFSGFKSGYPLPLWPNFFAFTHPVKTSALRVRITAVTPVGHPHVVNKTAEGRRVWLGEILALQKLGAAPLKTAVIAPVQPEDTHPPIPVRFTLPEAGFVTLVIEDGSGKRVRNLVSETWFPKGKNTAWWDGTDDLDRDISALKHGLYQIPTRFVTPGNYQARGLWRNAITPVFEFATYNAGNPPWSTPDHVGGWLANHSPPSAAVFVPASHSPTGNPAVFLGAFVTEGPDGLIWVDLDGTKRGGMRWIGGNWTAAPYLGRDTAPQANLKTAAFVASVGLGKNDQGKQVEELRITALDNAGNGTLTTRKVHQAFLEGGTAQNSFTTIRGVAAYDGVVACSINRLDQVRLFNAASGEILGNLPVKDPRGLIFDPQGRLLVLSGTSLVGYDSVTAPHQNAPPPRVLIAKGLEDPFAVEIGPDGRLFISDHGASHQVKVFAAKDAAKPTTYTQISTIGKPGKPRSGPYDPLHMNHPAELALDSQNQLWVAEHDSLPKRVSVWSPDGKFLRAVYGPAKYGGGGTLDPQNKALFYYADEQRGTLEFQLDWDRGETTLRAVLFRSDAEENETNHSAQTLVGAAPEVAVYRDGQRYFHNSYNSNPVGGSRATMLFIDRKGVAVPVAAMGAARNWKLLETEAFLPRWPDANLRDKKAKRNAVFLWTDQNADGHAQPDEVEIRDMDIRGGVVVQDDLSFAVANLDGNAARFQAVSFSPEGVPAYDLSHGQILAEHVLPPASSGGNQVLVGASGETVLTLGMEPFSAYSVTGAKNGQPSWSYPSLWPGLHASHHAAEPDHPGELIGTTRLLGGFVQPAGSEVAPLWAINGNMGSIYLFTRDGLFVATLFSDARLGTSWRMRSLPRGHVLDDVTLGTENFWPTLTQSPDGTIYLVDGARTSLVRLDGLETLREISTRPVTVTPEALAASRASVEAREAARQKAFGTGVLTARLMPSPSSTPWNNAEWVEIDQRGEGANFNSDAKPYNLRGAIAADPTALHVAWDTNDPKLLANSGEEPQAPFVTGGALDLMLGTRSGADPERKAPVEGDLRLVVTKVKGQTKAMLYRAVVPGTPAKNKVTFTSPVGSVSFDRIEDVSKAVTLTENGKGRYEISVPLEILGLKPVAGQQLKGDLGVLRGSDFRTVARSYWSNKSSGLTADVPSEARLTPQLWGTIQWR